MPVLSWRGEDVRRKLNGVVASVLNLLIRRVLALLVLKFHGDWSKDLEIVVLRHELAILRRQAKRPQLNETDRLFLAAASLPTPDNAHSYDQVKGAIGLGIPQFPRCSPS